jgi:hypothetical protein
MNGKEMADRIKLIRPDIKVLSMSGYSSGIMAKRGIDPTIWQYLNCVFKSQAGLFNIIYSHSINPCSFSGM